MKPAPPVTRIIWFARLFAPASLAFAAAVTDAVIVAVPGDEARKPVFERRMWRESGRSCEAIDRCVRRAHVARLHGTEVANRATTEQPLERRDETGQLDGL